MQIQAKNPEDYIKKLPEERQTAISNLRKAILDNLPPGFTETISYGMIGYVVPHTIYSKGYHTDPGQALPFMGIASQKNYISVYHMGIFADKNLYDWFIGEFQTHSGKKPDMGKSCIRFRKPDHIPYSLIGQLASKLTVNDWIKIYESNIAR